MYKPTIGCEVHCELATDTKLFCGCKNKFGDEPNTNCCPVCIGLPGAMPMLNEKAVEYTVMAGLALGCKINKFTKWDRKNYFYPDLPKSWQISQFDLPLCYDGKLDFELNGKSKTVRINRIHLEEDAGKLSHVGDKSYIDYNRCGVPLIEIVTEPDLHSANEVIAFLEELRSVLRYVGVSDAKMQEGNFRIDINLSVAKDGMPLGVRTETKNLSSFHAVKAAIEHETKRQIELLSGGGVVELQTRRFDEDKCVNYPLRIKETTNDYRFIVEPDLSPVELSDERLAVLSQNLPRLAAERVEAYTNEYGIPKPDAKILTSDIAISRLFEDVVSKGIEPRSVANFIIHQILWIAKTSDDLSLRISSEQTADVLNLWLNKRISNLGVKKLLEELWGKDDNALSVAKRLDILHLTDEKQICKIFDATMCKYGEQLQELKRGNNKMRGFLIGEVVKASKGRIEPQTISSLIDKILNDE